MIFLKSQVTANLDGTLPGVRRALQQAVEIEHATLPTYLYALYSLDPCKNKQIRKLILSIILEEMLHMALACNILNAVAGTPEIDYPYFIPKYPGHLPGSVEDQLIIPLSPFSKNLVKDVFMVIEQPEKPLKFSMSRIGVATAPLTIGQFYEKIRLEIINLSKTQRIFTGDPKRQLTRGLPSSELIAVTDANSASAAIRTIVQQGEGTRSSPLDPQGKPAHYYRYDEILHGHNLIPNPHNTPHARRFVYRGAAIPFDPSGVYPVVSNPKTTDYAPCSKARSANENFNYSYTSLLKCLHLVFNGNPDLLGSAIALMESLKEQAMTMMSSIEVINGVMAGPSFEYQPTNPP